MNLQLESISGYFVPQNKRSTKPIQCETHRNFHFNAIWQKEKSSFYFGNPDAGDGFLKPRQLLSNAGQILSKKRCSGK